MLKTCLIPVQYVFAGPKLVASNWVVVVSYCNDLLSLFCTHIKWLVVLCYILYCWRLTNLANWFDVFSFFHIVRWRTVSYIHAIVLVMLCNLQLYHIYLIYHVCIKSWFFLSTIVIYMMLDLPPTLCFIKCIHILLICISYASENAK